MLEKSYKHIVILSGKGGTGKTTIATAFASLVNNKIVIDCDVDAANMHITLNPEVLNRFPYSGGKKAEIDRSKCDECGLCENVCRFNAINNFTIDQLSCEGCGFCYNVCPSDAIKFIPSKSGTYYECKLPDESKFFYAKLNPGEGNSGKLVSELKKKALANVPSDVEWVIVDGPPGIGCPVNSSLSNTDFVVIVTEPTISGMHDLKRLVQLLDTFQIRSGIVINKFDLNEKLTAQIFNYADNEQIPIIGTIPYDMKFVHALNRSENIVEVNDELKEDFLTILRQLELQVEISVN